jgi:hypothetical protein
MLKTIQTAALSLGVLLGGFAALPAVAQADTLQVTIAPETVQYRHDGRHDRRYDRHRERPRRACSPERAVEKAWRLGLNRPRIANVNRNTISVRGFKRGHPVRILFARAPNCPVIR